MLKFPGDGVRTGWRASRKNEVAHCSRKFDQVKRTRIFRTLLLAVLNLSCFKIITCYIAILYYYSIAVIGQLLL